MALVADKFKTKAIYLLFTALAILAWIINGTLAGAFAGGVTAGLLFGITQNNIITSKKAILRCIIEGLISVVFVGLLIFKMDFVMHSNWDPSEYHMFVGILGYGIIVLVNNSLF